jgi:hypothetical protein
MLMRRTLQALWFYRSGEYLENRNLDSIARDLAQAGLDAFSESNSFYVKVQEFKRVKGGKRSATPEPSDAG